MAEQHKGLRIASGILLVLAAVTSFLPTSIFVSMRFRFDLQDFFVELLIAAPLLIAGVLILCRHLRIAGIVIGVFALFEIGSLIYTSITSSAPVGLEMFISTFLTQGGGILIALALLLPHRRSAWMCILGALLRFIASVYSVAVYLPGNLSFLFVAMTLVLIALFKAGELAGWILLGVWFPSQKR